MSVDDVNERVEHIRAIVPAAQVVPVLRIVQWNDVGRVPGSSQPMSR